jgi:hypothetical protein
MVGLSTEFVARDVIYFENSSYLLNLRSFKIIFCCLSIQEKVTYKMHMLENRVYDDKVAMKDISEILKVSVFYVYEGQFTQPPTVIVD